MTYSLYPKIEENEVIYFRKEPLLTITLSDYLRYNNLNFYKILRSSNHSTLIDEEEINRIRKIIENHNSNITVLEGSYIFYLIFMTIDDYTIFKLTFGNKM